ncbi:MAG TPA: FlgD immunoglobulin-like domain containing protein [Fibrobacteria bacterium]|nr:FlgD immunoglobulin-like domain containing protein [Fibrobacteria bacterium]
MTPIRPLRSMKSPWLTALAAALMAASEPEAFRDTKLSSGGGNTFVSLDGVGLYGSGSNGSSYLLGLGVTTSTFTTHQRISTANWRSFSSANSRTLAIKSDSTLWAWGSGSGYAFGNGSTSALTTPTQIGSDRWLTVAANVVTGSARGIKADSTLWVWGTNSSSSYLGDGTDTTRQTPVRIGSGKWLDVSSISTHTLAIRSDSTLWVWGSNSTGQFGNGTTSSTPTKSPAQIGTDKWIRVFTGDLRSYGLKPDSTLWVWGSNGSGLLGLGTTSGTQTTPVQVGSGKWLQLVFGRSTMHALKADSTLWAWGAASSSSSGSTYGMLGLGSKFSDSVPCQIGSSKWLDFYPGGNEVIAQDASGNYWAWGKNASGGIGNGTSGTNNWKLTPTQVYPGKTLQTITFPSLSAKVYGDTDYTPGASASSGLAVSYASSNTSVAAIVGGKIHIVGVGTATLTASQAGNFAYVPATDVSQGLTVSKGSQTITFDTLAAKTIGDPAFSLGATASSGLSVSYASSNTSVATISGSTITIVGIGTSNITASQAGDGNYDAAADVARSLTVSKLAQTITFNAPSAKTCGDTAFTLGATASSGLPVSYASSDTTVARISGSTVTVIAAGSADITASQAGNATYSSATDVVRTLTVNKAPQTISFPALAPKTMLDADFAPGASASSGLSVSYASSDTTVAAMVSGQIHIVGAGTAIITASQAGNSNYNAAPDSARSLTVSLESQTITFNALSSKTYGDGVFGLSATAGPGLSVTYSSSDTTVARISGSTVTMIGAGSADITASQAGNGTYAAATPVTRTLTVNKAGQTISFPDPAAKDMDDGDFAPGASASSGLAVAYSSSNTSVATMVSGQIHIVGAGSVTITASQGGNSNYLAAANSSRTITVSKLAQTITFDALSTKTFGDASFSLGAAASSGLAVSYASSDTAVAKVSGSTVTVIASGTADITASQAGNGLYSSATDVVRTLTVNKKFQVVSFSALAAKTMLDADFAPGATAGSGLSVSYSSSNALVATIVSGQIHIAGPGTSTITASQAGDANYLAAADASQTLSVTMADQTITFAALPPRTYGDSAFAPGAAASSGLPVSYASSDTTVAAIVGGRIRLLGSGSAVITASQAGNADYLAAVEATQALTVAKAAHTLTFSLGADTLKTEGDSAFKLKAESSAGLAVRFTSSDTTVARVAGDSVRIGRTGIVELTAHQDGNARYAAATSVTRALRVRTAIPAALALGDLHPQSLLDADTSIRLGWSRKEKSTGYRIQADTDPAGSSPLLDASLADTSFTLGGIAFGSAVKWRVAPFNAAGQAAFSPWADIKVRPAPPLPIDVSRIPIQAKEGTGTTVELTWPKAYHATGYRMQAALDTALAPSLDTLLGGPAFTLRDLAPGSRCFWRVTPVNGISQAPFTPWLSFKVRERDEGSVTRGIVVDSTEPVKVGDIVAVTPKDSTLGNVTLTVTEEKKAPANLPEGFLPLTGNINLNAVAGSGQLNDGQITITLTPPDTSLDGTPIDDADQPLVYTVDSATGELRVVYDLPRDSSGRIVLPLSQGKSFILAVDTVSPVVKDSTPSEPRPSGSNLVISGVVDDNIRNCRTTLRYRRGGEEAFDSVTVTMDASGRFELPLELKLDSTGFEYALSATDGRNVRGTPSSNVPVEIGAIQAADSLPSMQWRLFALPTLPKEARWADLVPALGTYGEDWKLFARTAGGLKEFGEAMDKAEAGAAYWLKSRKKGFTPAIAGGVAAPVNKPFEVVLPPKAWISFGNPFLFPVSWQSVLDSSHAVANALVGPYTFRDTAWVPPLEIPALLPWEGYYAYNATLDTLRIRIPALKARTIQPALAKAAFHLQWQVRGADGKDAGNYFGGLGGRAAGEAASLGKVSSGAASQAASKSPLWQTPKPESPDAGLRAGFVSSEGTAGLLQTDFRDFAAGGGLIWSARLSGLQAGRNYTNRFLGFESLPGGMAVAVADPVTGSFMPWSADMAYTVETQAGEESRELLFFAGSPEYVRSRGTEFAAAHPFTIELKNYPNPMRGHTVIHFAVPVSVKGRQKVKLNLYDMQGRLVRLLASDSRPTGRHSLRWDGLDGRGRRVAAGSYRLLLEIGNRKMDRPLQILP